MATLSLPTFEELKDLATDRPIGDSTLPNRALACTGSAALSEAFDGFKFSGAATAEVQLAIVNSPDDEDPTGLLALKGDATEELEGATIATRVPFRAGSGYLCLVGLRAGVKATGGGSLDALGFKFSGAAEVTLGCVRNHPAAHPVHTAITALAADYPTFLSLDAVRALGPHDAVLYAYNGGLKLNLTVELADLAGPIAAAAERIVAAAAQGVKISSGLTFTGAVAVADSFRLVATPAGGGRTRVTVHKALERAVTLGASVGVDIRFDPAELLKPLDALTTALFQQPWRRLEPLLARSVDQLSARERELVEEVLVKAGRERLEDALNLDHCQQIVAGLRDTLETELKRTFAGKWNFNYSRIRAEAAILQAVLTPAALERVHGELLRFRLDGLLAEDAAGVEVEVFLAKRTRTIKFEYGLSLAWGDFTLLAGRAQRERTWITLTDRAGARRASFTGKAGYATTWLGEKSVHTASFGATMPEFSRANPLRAIDYELGLALSFTWDNVKFDDEAVLEIADHGAVAGAIGPDDMDDTLVALRDTHGIAKSTRGSAIVHLQVDNDLLGQLLAVISGPARLELTAAALGAALCYREESEYAVRQSVTARAQAYGPIWATYLSEEDWDAGDVARAASTVLAKQHKRLAQVEYSFVESNGDRSWTAGAMVMLHSGRYPFRDLVKSLWLGCEQLSARAQSGATDKLLETAYAQLKEAWEDHFPTRMTAALLVEAAKRVPKGLERLARRLEFTVKGATPTTKIVFARGQTG